MDEQLLMCGRSNDELPSHRDKKEPTTSTATAVAKLIGLTGVACVLLLIVGVYAWGFFMLLTTRPAVISVTVDGFSGIEDRVPRAFNLTMGIDNLRGAFEVCVGGEAVVMYQGVPLAVGRVEELCVPRDRAAGVSFVAASGGVGVPGALAELMAGEKRADGAVLVDVRVVVDKHTWLLSCPATLDDQGAARPYPCKRSVFYDESDGVRPDGSGTPGAPL